MLNYRRSFTFDVPHTEVWRAVCSSDSYEEWAPWMRDLRVVGDGFEPGTRFIFEVASRLPVRMDLEIEIVAVKEGEFVEARVSRDLVGSGRLRLRPQGRRTGVELSWEVDVASRPLRRVAVRVGTRRSLDPGVGGASRYSGSPPEIRGSLTPISPASPAPLRLPAGIRPPESEPIRAIIPTLPRGTL